MYICSCEDNDEGRRICKHIHAVVNFMKKISQPAKRKAPTEEIELIQDIACDEKK